MSIVPFSTGLIDFMQKRFDALPDTETISQNDFKAALEAYHAQCAKNKVADPDLSINAKDAYQVFEYVDMDKRLTGHDFDTLYKYAHNQIDRNQNDRDRKDKQYVTLKEIIKLPTATAVASAPIAESKPASSASKPAKAEVAEPEKTTPPASYTGDSSAYQIYPSKDPSKVTIYYYSDKKQRSYAATFQYGDEIDSTKIFIKTCDMATVDKALAFYKEKNPNINIGPINFSAHGGSGVIGPNEEGKRSTGTVEVTEVLDILKKYTNKIDFSACELYSNYMSDTKEEADARMQKIITYADKNNVDITANTLVGGMGFDISPGGAPFMATAEGDFVKVNRPLWDNARNLRWLYENDPAPIMVGAMDQWQAHGGHTVDENAKVAVVNWDDSLDL